MVKMIIDEKAKWSDFSERLRPYIDSAVPYTEEKLREITVERKCQTICSMLSECLRWAYENNNYQTVQLNNSLIPSLEPEDKHYWDCSVKTCGFSNEQIETILKEFGEKEITKDKPLNLIWGGYIKREDNGYILEE